MRRHVILGTAAAILIPALARAQGVQIDHKAVGCIVVGKYPRMNACLTPAADVAKARVYFRPEGNPLWYYVDMKADQACYAGVLPKPGKSLVGKKIEYYLESQDKTFNAARTAEYDPIVVRSAQECKKQAPVAPFLNNASVAVFPSVPAGFTAVGSTIGTGALIGVVGGGAALASAAVVVATNNNDTTTTVPVGVNTTTTLAATTTTMTPTTTLPSQTNHPPFAVLTVNPDPPVGLGPLTVDFDLCKSTDPDAGDTLSYFFDFGDGAKSSGSCATSHTYAASFRAATGSVRALDKSYAAESCVVDSKSLSQCRTRNVVAQVPAPTTTTTTTTTTTLPPCPTPTITMTSPMNNDTIACDVTVSLIISNTDTVSGGFNTTDCGGGGTVFSGLASGSTFTITLPLLRSCVLGTYRGGVTAFNNCGNQASTPVITVFDACPLPFRNEPASLALWSSDLKLEGGRLQVIVNGGAVSNVERGRSVAAARITDGENRVEATVVDGAGKAGTWTIDFSGSESVQAGSLRVLGGQIDAISASSVTFRLQGKPGERVALTFLKK